MHFLSSLKITVDSTFVILFISRYISVLQWLHRCPRRPDTGGELAAPSWSRFPGAWSGLQRKRHCILIFFIDFGVIIIISLLSSVIIRIPIGYLLF